mmetsp:Transcript_60794/g.144853  ORF Transcript_60794/g.144853 Transcript_60794/m.144853 type:complete len:380 (+) Transcript_60794:84-1223(+)
MSLARPCLAPAPAVRVGVKNTFVDVAESNLEEDVEVSLGQYGFSRFFSEPAPAVCRQTSVATPMKATMIPGFGLEECSEDGTDGNHLDEGSVDPDQDDDESWARLQSAESEISPPTTNNSWARMTTGDLDVSGWTRFVTGDLLFGEMDEGVMGGLSLAQTSMGMNAMNGCMPPLPIDPQFLVPMPFGQPGVLGDVTGLNGQDGAYANQQAQVLSSSSASRRRRRRGGSLIDKAKRQQQAQVQAQATTQRENASPAAAAMPGMWGAAAAGSPCAAPPSGGKNPNDLVGLVAECAAAMQKKMAQPGSPAPTTKAKAAAKAPGSPASTAASAPTTAGKGANAAGKKAGPSFCPFCGGAVGAGFKFCQFCGSDLSSVSVRIVV